MADYMFLLHYVYRDWWPLPLDNPSDDPKSTTKEEDLFPRCSGQLSRKVFPDPG